MTQEVKVLLNLPGDLHLISRDHMIEGENQFLQVIL